VILIYEYLIFEMRTSQTPMVVVVEPGLNHGIPSQ